MKSLKQTIRENLRLIIHQRNLKQSFVGNLGGISESQFSRVLSGQVSLSLEQLESIASGLGMRVIDIITYPDVYVSKKELEEDQDVILQFKLRKDMKDKVMNLAFGENVKLLNV